MEVVVLDVSLDPSRRDMAEARIKCVWDKEERDGEASLGGVRSEDGHEQSGGMGGAVTYIYVHICVVRCFLSRMLLLLLVGKGI